MRSFFTRLLGFVLLSVIASAQQARPIVISRVAVVDVISGRINSEMTVVIEGERVVALGNAAQTPIPARAHVIDGRRLFLIPGLWDMHVHLSYARTSALPALVANGVTTIRDMGSTLSELDDWRSQIATGTFVGPQIVRAGPILNGQQFNRYQTAISTDAEARAAVRTLHNVGVDFVKLHRQTPRAAFFAVADETKRLSLPFVGHIPITVTPVEASDAGQQTVEHVETLFEGTFATANKGKDLSDAIAVWRVSDARSLFAKFVANGTFVTPTLVAQRQILSWLDSSATTDPRARYVAASAKQETEKLLGPARAKADQLIPERQRLLAAFSPVVAMMQETGVNVLAGTDLASSFLYPGFSLHDELVSLVEAGLTPVEALRTATLNAGRLFPNLRTGTIAVGQRADLVLLDANPLADIRNTQRIRTVILRGKLLDRKALDSLLLRASELAVRN